MSNWAIVTKVDGHYCLYIDKNLVAQVSERKSRARLVTALGEALLGYLDESDQGRPVRGGDSFGAIQEADLSDDSADKISPRHDENEVHVRDRAGEPRTEAQE